MANSAVSKHPKLSTTEDRISLIDRISTLPDSLLCHIISFLPTKHAVGTSILSTRWKFLWTSITNLDFDDGLFLQPNLAELDLAQVQEYYMKFMHFVNRVLVLLNQPRIHKFRLKCGQSYDELYINSWISAAIGRGVQELDLFINFSLEERIDPLPRSLFTCNTLAVLKLDGDLIINNSTSSVSFPSLKILHLISVEYENDECVHKLFQSCPILEDLVIERTCRDGVVTFNVCVPVLKRLKIFFDLDYDRDIDYNLQINAPALEYLDLTDIGSDNISLEYMSSLVEANIDVNICAMQGIDDNYYDVVSGILEGISNVKILSLSRPTMEALSYAPNSAPVFPNLTRLKVKFRSCHWQGLRSLLQNSNKLEDLICN